MNTQAKVIRDGKVAVLVSPGYRSPWSAWYEISPCRRLWCLYAPEVVAWVEAGKPGGLSRLEELAGSAYCGGGMDLEIQWLPIGTKFRVIEHDGSEELELADDIEWDIASADPIQSQGAEGDA